MPDSGGLEEIALKRDVLLPQVGTHGWPIAESREAPAAERRFWFLPLAVFLTVLVAGAAVGLVVYRSAERSVIHYVDLNLDAVARLKADQISHWLEEIEEGIEVEAHRVDLAAATARWLDAGMTEGPRKAELMGILGKLCAVPDAIECSLHSPDHGELWISNGFGSDSGSIRAQAVAAAPEVEPQLEDFYVQHRANPGRTEIGYFYGVRRSSPPNDAIAVFHMTVDPTGLFRVASDEWPGLNSSFETVLLRRDGARAIAQVPMREGQERQPSVPLSQDSRQVSVQAVQGKTGFLTGVDDRLLPVFARALPVFGTPWFVMSKVDQSEAFAQLHTVAISAATTLTALLLIGCVAWAGRRRQLWSLEQTRTEQLMLTRRIDYLARYANDCIILADAKGRILEVNDHCALTYGYAAPELTRMRLGDLLPAGAPMDFPTLLAKLRTHGSLIYETEHRRKDGSLVPVEVSACLIDADGKGVLQAIIRDISERRNAEAEREASMAHHRELSRRLMSMQEQERRRISADLHDGAVASLAAIKLNLNAIAKAFPETSGLGASIVAETRELLSETIEQIRELCADLRPSTLDQMGLVAAIQSLARQLSMRSGVDVRLQCDEPDRRFAPEVESILFRIAQEALRNCAKHARAHGVEIQLARSAGRVELTITDDGVGFDRDSLEASTGGSGLGLPTMRERAEFAGAEFEITSSPGIGTRIRVCLDSDKAFRPSQ
jgi:PAS domain S-box-containing protein